MEDFEIFNFNYCKYYLTPDEEGFVNKKLPHELFKNILSYLNQKDMQSTVTVCKLWSRLTVETAKYHESDLIRDFSVFLAKNLDEKIYAEKIKTLNDISFSCTIIESVNLKMLNHPLEI